MAMRRAGDEADLPPGWRYNFDYAADFFF